ncbi:unnamed protein product [Amoebophrya sp. A25]|nr:unnamed protein product [Amoebophrya sp. A25]|eukprot:GSA25T00008420001.1
MRSYFGCMLLGMSGWTGMPHHVVTAASPSHGGGGLRSRFTGRGPQGDPVPMDTATGSPPDTSNTSRATAGNDPSSRGDMAPAQMQMDEFLPCARAPQQQNMHGVRFLSKERSPREKAAGIATGPESCFRPFGTEEGTQCSGVLNGCGFCCEDGCVSALSLLESVIKEFIFSEGDDPEGDAEQGRVAAAAAARPDENELRELGAYFMGWIKDDLIAQYYNDPALCRAPHEELQRWKNEKYFGNDVREMLPFMTAEAIQRRHACVGCGQALCAAEACCSVSTRCWAQSVCAVAVVQELTRQMPFATTDRKLTDCETLSIACMGIATVCCSCSHKLGEWCHCSMWKHPGEVGADKPHQLDDCHLGNCAGFCCDAMRNSCWSGLSAKKTMSMGEIDQAWVVDNYAKLHRESATDPSVKLKDGRLTFHGLQEVVPKGVKLPDLFAGRGSDSSSTSGSTILPCLVSWLGAPSLAQVEEFQEAARREMLEELDKKRRLSKPSAMRLPGGLPP